MQDEQPDHDEIVEASGPTFGSMEDQGVTFGDIAGAPEPETRTVGPTGICICPPPAELDGMPQLDSACPTHGTGPKTIADAQRVNEAMRERLETTGDSGGSPIALGGFNSSQTHDVPTTPGGVAPAEGAPSLEDFPLDEAPASALQGNVTDLGASLNAMVLKAAERHARGERATAGANWMPVPDPENPQQMAIGGMIYLEIPGMILGTCLINTKILPFVHGWTQEFIDAQVGDMWETARRQRSEQPASMQQMQQEARNAAASNGRGNGLIIPG